MHCKRTAGSVSSARPQLVVTLHRVTPPRTAGWCIGFVLRCNCGPVPANWRTATARHLTRAPPRAPDLSRRCGVEPCYSLNTQFVVRLPRGRWCWSAWFLCTADHCMTGYVEKAGTGLAGCCRLVRLTFILHSTGTTALHCTAQRLADPVANDCQRIANGLPTDCQRLPTDCQRIANGLLTDCQRIANDCQRLPTDCQRIANNCQ